MPDSEVRGDPTVVNALELPQEGALQDPARSGQDLRERRTASLRLQEIQDGPGLAGGARKLCLHNDLVRPRVRQRRLPGVCPGPGGHPGGTREDPNRNPRRRQAANRAWAEYTPAGITFKPETGPLDEIRIYRSFVLGDLLELVMTDERLYRDGPPCGNMTEDRYLTPGCGEEEATGRTMLGLPQRDGFFLDRVTESPRTWKIWGNEVIFMQFKVLNAYLGETPGSIFPTIPQTAGGAEEGVYVTLDQWDGYQAERRAITEKVRDLPVENFVTITGDIHSYLAGYIKPDYDKPITEPGNEPVGVEFVCGSVTSSNLTELASFGRGRAPAPDGNEFTTATTSSNPHIKYFNSDNHGYNLIDLTKGSLLCTMVGLSSLDPNEPNPIRVKDDTLVEKALLKEFKVDAGEVLIQVRDEGTGTFVPLPPA